MKLFVMKCYFAPAVLFLIFICLNKMSLLFASSPVREIEDFDKSFIYAVRQLESKSILHVREMIKKHNVAVDSVFETKRALDVAEDADRDVSAYQKLFEMHVKLCDKIKDAENSLAEDIIKMSKFMLNRLDQELQKAKESNDKDLIFRIEAESRKLKENVLLKDARRVLEVNRSLSHGVHNKELPGAEK